MAKARFLQLPEELRILSCQDSLTGLANRRMSDMLFGVEWAKARQPPSAFVPRKIGGT